jgi:hypothetical protein
MPRGVVRFFFACMNYMMYQVSFHVTHLLLMVE